MKTATLKRTTTDDPGFQLLVSQLDNELWNELNEDQATYDQYNKVPGLSTALMLYINGEPVACGCIKAYSDDTAEVKRMYVTKTFRGKGLSKLILDELEKWALELGFSFTILETSIHFKVARSLYSAAGYDVIDNYDQYAGLSESVCMRKKLVQPEPSEFKNLQGIEYFDFEEDFIEKNIRCIPMIVRFKMDKAGIKLKLAEWSRFAIEERIELATKPCANETDVASYNKYLAALIVSKTGKNATELMIDKDPEWSNTAVVPELLNEKLGGFNWNVSIQQWKELSDLQRFALMKLCKEGHENKNFPKAMKEFKLINGD